MDTIVVHNWIKFESKGHPRGCLFEVHDNTRQRMQDIASGCQTMLSFVSLLFQYGFKIAFMGF